MAEADRLDSDSGGGSANDPTGPRGGTTTRTDSGMVKKNLWIPEEVAEVLRAKAFHERRSEASIVREGLRVVLGLAVEEESPEEVPR